MWCVVVVQGARDLNNIADDTRLFDALSESEQAIVVRMWAVLVPFGVDRVHVARLLSLLQVLFSQRFMCCSEGRSQRIVVSSGTACSVLDCRYHFVHQRGVVSLFTGFSNVEISSLWWGCVIVSCTVSCVWCRVYATVRCWQWYRYWQRNLQSHCRFVVTPSMCR